MSGGVETDLDEELLFVEICLDHTICQGIYTWFSPAERTIGKWQR